MQGKIKLIYWYTKIHTPSYTTKIAANTQIHDTRNFDTRVKL